MKRTRSNNPPQTSVLRPTREKKSPDVLEQDLLIGCCSTKVQISRFTAEPVLTLPSRHFYFMQPDGNESKELRSGDCGVQLKSDLMEVYLLDRDYQLMFGNF